MAGTTNGRGLHNADKKTRERVAHEGGMASAKSRSAHTTKPTDSQKQH
jgi:hypothetical protein